MSRQVVSGREVPRGMAPCSGGARRGSDLTAASPRAGEAAEAARGDGRPERRERRAAAAHARRRREPRPAGPAGRAGEGQGGGDRVSAAACSDRRVTRCGNDAVYQMSRKGVFAYLRSVCLSDDALRRFPPTHNQGPYDTSLVTCPHRRAVLARGSAFTAAKRAASCTPSLGLTAREAARARPRVPHRAGLSPPSRSLRGGPRRGAAAPPLR